jgi:hypothetical protein
MYFNPIRIMKLPFDVLSALPFQVCAVSDRLRHRRHPFGDSGYPVANL